MDKSTTPLAHPLLQDGEIGPITLGIITGKATGRRRLSRDRRRGEKRGRNAADILAQEIQAIIALPGKNIETSAWGQRRGRRLGETTQRILCGARTEEQLKDNLGATDWTITAAEIERLDRASQTVLPYPAYFFRNMSGDRNPALFPYYPPAP